MADKNQVNNPRKVHWITYAFAALSMLIVLFGLAYLISGREIIERPILIFFLLLAWLGLLSGIALGRSKN